MISKKSYLYLLPMLFAAVLSMSACHSSKENNVTVSSDSVQTVDSIAMAQEMAAQKEMEQARMDSIKQDSIRQIIARIPTFKEFRDIANEFDTEKQLRFFRSRGFTASSKKYTYTVSEEDAGEEEPGTYTAYTPVVARLIIDGKEVCKYQQINEHGWGFKITVKDAPEVLQQMKKDADKYFKKDVTSGGDDLYWKQFCRCQVKGDTFEYFIDQDGD